MQRADRVSPRVFLFATFDGGGALPPMLTTAAKLIAHGHRVRVLGEPSTRAEIEACGASFISWTRAPHRQVRSRANDPVRDWEAATAEEGVRHVVDVIMCGPALGHAQDVIEELEREPAHLVVSHDMLFGVFAGCESRGQPFAIFSPNLSLYPVPGLPPFGPGLKPARTPEEVALHAQIAAAVSALFDAGLPSLNAAREQLRLPPLDRVFEQVDAAAVHLLGTSRAFDFECEPPPSQRYVGPQFCDPRWVAPWTSPWSPGDARPLVLVSFSTTYQNHAQVLQRIIDAAAGMPIRLLVTLGNAIEPGDLQAADNTVIVASAPHSVLMPQAACVVTHGGHGTVMLALSHGLPLLLMPHGRDQNDNAIRVTERGAGVALSAQAATAEIAAAMARLLADPQFRCAARRLGAAIAMEAANSRIVEELECASRGGDANFFPLRAV